MTARPITILLPTRSNSARLHAPQGCTIVVIDQASSAAAWNRALAESWDRQSDLLLAGPDTVITADDVNEMQSVLLLHERHGVVSPRTNRGVLLSVPFTESFSSEDDAYVRWRQLYPYLPRYSPIPVAAEFCCLIRRELLVRFGLFDECYTDLFHALHDFICRVNRCGYSAIGAHRVFVPAHEIGSVACECDRQRLSQNCPEFSSLVERYRRFQSDPFEHYASLFSNRTKPRVLFDLFHLSPHHNGTSHFGFNLLREFSRMVEDEFELYLGISDICLDYFGPEAAGYRPYTGPVKEDFLFDLVFKPSQMYRWDEFNRATRCGPILCLTIQDAIAIRCGYLNTPRANDVFRKSALLSDHVFAISEATRRDFNALCGTGLQMQVIHHGSSWTDMPEAPSQRDYVLLVGNAYAHKAVLAALEAIAGIFPVVVLGLKSPPKNHTAARWYTSGQLTERDVIDLFYHARVILYPSQYEGFGLPIIDASALGKPVIVADTEVNREISEALEPQLLRRFSCLDELPRLVQEAWNDMPQVQRVRSWTSAAEQYVTAIRALLARGIDEAKVRARWEWIRTVESISLNADGD